jgi:hypothetical protein
MNIQFSGKLGQSWVATGLKKEDLSRFVLVAFEERKCLLIWVPPDSNTIQCIDNNAIGSLQSRVDQYLRTIYANIDGDDKKDEEMILFTAVSNASSFLYCKNSNGNLMLKAEATGKTLKELKGDLIGNKEWTMESALNNMPFLKAYLENSASSNGPNGPNGLKGDTFNSKDVKWLKAVNVSSLSAAARRYFGGKTTAEAGIGYGHRVREVQKDPKGKGQIPPDLIRVTEDENTKNKKKKRERKTKTKGEDIDQVQVQVTKKRTKKVETKTTDDLVAVVSRYVPFCDYWDELGARQYIEAGETKEAFDFDF